MPAPTDAVVEFVDVTKAFGESLKAAIEGISFAESRGSLTCVLGKSGCGKTTILNLIAGFLVPTSGSVLVNGAAVKGPGPDRAVVFQDYALLPWFTVRRNVELGLGLQGISRADARARADEYLGLVGLQRAVDMYPHQLSGGMQQRASMARALALDPVILLMDEPFAGLDAYTRMDMQTELLRIWNQTGKTVLFVTHSVDEAVFLGTRLIILGGHPGRILEVIDLDLPRPRDRTSVEFNDVKRLALERISSPDAETARDEEASPVGVT